MTPTAGLQPVDDAEILRWARSLLSEVVDAPSHLRQEWLHDKAWAVVPVESAKHFDDADAARIADASLSMGNGDCLAIAVEPLENQTLCYKVTVSSAGLADFSWECGSFAYLLVPKDCGWCLLCNFALYYLVAGPRQFVEHAIGCSIKEGRKKFIDFANECRGENLDTGFVDEATQLHQEIVNVADRYKVFDGERGGQTSYEARRN